MVTDLNHRVTDDAQAVGDRVAGRASELQHRAGDAIEKVPGAHTLSEQIPKHPLTSVGAGLAAGMVLGMMGGGSDGHHDDGSSRGNGRHEEHGGSSNSGNSGLIGGIATAAITSIAIPIQHEIETVAREALDGFMGRGSSKSKQEQQSPATAAEQIPTHSDGAASS
jgi:hypothetical protein